MTESSAPGTERIRSRPRHVIKTSELDINRTDLFKYSLMLVICHISPIVS